MLAHTLAFGKPVENVTRIESFNSPFVNWIKVSMVPADPKLLAINTGTEIKLAR